MKGLKITVGVLLGIMSAWLILNGLALAIQTMGHVTGTEFSMLITLANILATIAAWLGLFGLWIMMPSDREETDTAESAGDQSVGG